MCNALKCSPWYITSTDAVLQEGRRDKFDHVVIETTGLADPQPIIMTFRGHPVRSPFMQRIALSASSLLLQLCALLHMHICCAYRPCGTLHRASDLFP